jgi:tRNA 2-(methylsulfanyl)-N6-isopentenyladenosine37 hydroxylase
MKACPFGTQSPVLSPYFCPMASNPNKVMLGLRLPTDPRWVNIVEKDIEEILTDHAYCEQKAASNAISCIVKYPEYSDVVDEMVRICNEEMTHFGMVHDELKKRGLTLGRERKDPYVHDLMDFIMKGGGSREAQFVDRMLFAAMIEARSCERFRLLSEEISDEGLRDFYRSLMESEAEHYATFIGFARKYAGNIDVDTRWKEFLEYEATLMGKYGKAQTMHG